MLREWRIVVVTKKTPAQKFLICWARLLRLSGRSFENLGLVFFGGRREGGEKTSYTYFTT